MLLECNVCKCNNNTYNTTSMVAEISSSSFTNSGARTLGSFSPLLAYSDAHITLTVIPEWLVVITTVLYHLHPFIMGLYMGEYYKSSINPTKHINMSICEHLNSLHINTFKLKD